MTGYNIYSANMLCVLIKRIFPDYKYKKNYFSDQRKGLEETLIDLFKLHGTLDFEQISEMMPYVDMNVVRQICSRRMELIRIGEGKYSLTEKIEFDDSDVCCSEKIIQDNIKARKYCLTNSLTVEKSIYLNDDIPVLTFQTVLFDRYFSDKYIRVGRLISEKDEAISVDRLLTDYCLEHKQITLEELENYELEITESDKRHSLKIANKYMIRTDADHFVSKDEISLADSTFRNIVIHEYAHYMVTHLYPKAAREEAAHGETWEECCYELGITPIVTYINEQLYKEWAHLLRPTSDEPSATIEEQ